MTNQITEKINWKPPNSWRQIKTVDMHTGGEPLRILVDGVPRLIGNSVLEKRREFKERYDDIRTGLMLEPRGHADMYGVILSSTTVDSADLDVFFIHNSGYSTMCGHAIIALAKFVIESKLIEKKEGAPIVFNTPAGLVTARCNLKEGIVMESSFRNVPSFVYAKQQKLKFENGQSIDYDIAYGGAFYAIVKSSQLSLDLSPACNRQLIEWGRKIKKAIASKDNIYHPVEPEMNFLYGTIFTGPSRNSNHHSQNVCVFADGEIDRSATGTGVSARAALLYDRGQIKVGQSIIVESIIRSTLTVSIVKTLDYYKYKAIIPEVSGTASFTGAHTFYFDPDDTFKKGFFIR